VMYTGMILGNAIHLQQGDDRKRCAEHLN